MYTLTLEKFKRIVSDKVTDADRIVAALNDLMPSYGVTNLNRVCHFLSQLSYESNRFLARVENLNYSSSGLMATFPKYFPTKSIADQYARKPEKIANRAYANRGGNGNESSGDGWRYRGRGFIQLTLKNNYKFYGDRIGINLVMNPDLASEVNISIKLALEFWKQRNLNYYADSNNFEKITYLINGSYSTAQVRKDEYIRIYKILK